MFNRKKLIELRMVNLVRAKLAIKEKKISSEEEIRYICGKDMQLYWLLMNFMDKVRK